MAPPDAKTWRRGHAGFRRIEGSGGHDPSIGDPPGLCMTQGAINAFDLREVAAVGPGGVPTLGGSNASILTTARFASADIGRQAICQDVLDAEEPTLIVLGIVADAVPLPDDETPLVLRTGAASLVLHPDGRTRMTGEAIAIDAAAGLTLLAATTDLN